MSHTNSTTNYGLPQFLSTDKPFWLTDVNQAYVAIDTGMKNAQDKADAADSTATSAASDASDALANAATADAKGAGAVASISETFSDVSTYNVGDLVIYNNLLYVCTVDVITPGAWTGLANWTRTTIDTEINKSISIGDLSDVDISGAAEGNLMQWKTVDGVLKLVPIASVVTFHNEVLSFANTKTVYTDVSYPASKIIPSCAILTADSGVPLTVTVQPLTASTSRIRVSAATNYASNLTVYYYTLN